MDAAALGMMALERGDWEKAELAFTELLDRDPHHPEANLGMARMALQAGYPEDVPQFTRQSKRPDPRLADLEYTALCSLRKKDEAVSGAIRFLEKVPAAAEFRLRIGQDLLAEERFVEALDLFRVGARHDPRSHVMAGGEAAACLGLGRMVECRAAVERRLMLLPRDPLVRSHWLVLHSGMSSVSAADLLEMGLKWDELFGTAGREDSTAPSCAAGGAGDGRVRIGFVSSTFRHHANCQFLLPLLEALDRKRFAIFAYHDGSHRDEVTKRCEKAVDRFRSIHGLPGPAALQVIREDRIDVLIDINAHYDSARMMLFTHRLAPVQVHYLGGTATTGLRGMDWRLADDLNEPDEGRDAEIGTERIHRLAGGIHAFHPLRPTADPSPLPMAAKGHVTFGCLNALAKMEDEVLALWARCLEAVPDSRLRLVKQCFRHEQNRADFSRRAALLGIDPSRLELMPAETGAFDDLSVYHGIDIALDTFAYNGITTTCEALWMGVPVITLRGDRFVAREAAGILTRTGHSAWIAATPDAYVEIACSLASDREGLSNIRLGLRKEFIASPLHDAARLAREMEAFFDAVLAEVAGA